MPGAGQAVASGRSRLSNAGTSTGDRVLLTSVRNEKASSRTHLATAGWDSPTNDFTVASRADAIFTAAALFTASAAPRFFTATGGVTTSTRVLATPATAP